MDKLIEILEDIQPGVDFRNCDTLIEDGLLDSFAILSIVSEFLLLRQKLSRRTSTLQKHCGIWCAD